MEKEEKKEVISQDERWLRQYDSLMSFLENNHRRPSKYILEEKLMHGWLRRNIKLLSRGDLPSHRLERFKELLELAEKYHHKNQYE